MQIVKYIIKEMDTLIWQFHTTLHHCHLTCPGQVWKWFRHFPLLYASLPPVITYFCLSPLVFKSCLHLNCSFVFDWFIFKQISFRFPSFLNTSLQYYMWLKSIPEVEPCNVNFQLSLPGEISLSCWFGFLLY